MIVILVVNSMVHAVFEDPRTFNVAGSHFKCSVGKPRQLLDLRRRVPKTAEFFGRGAISGLPKPENLRGILRPIRAFETVTCLS
jgi:hypothetical protein